MLSFLDSISLIRLVLHEISAAEVLRNISNVGYKVHRQTTTLLLRLELKINIIGFHSAFFHAFQLRISSKSEVFL